MTAGGAASLFCFIVFNLASAIEHASEIVGATDNPLDAPVFVGPKGEARKISGGLKHKIASMAAQGHVFHSGAAVVAGMELLGKRFMACAKTGNKWSEPLAFQYLHTLPDTFRIRLDGVPIYSLSWDATRLSHLDVLATTSYNPGLDLAGWCPPQAQCFCLFIDRA